MRQKRSVRGVHSVLILACLVQGVLWWQWKYPLRQASSLNSCRDERDQIAYVPVIQRPTQPAPVNRDVSSMPSDALITSLARAFPRWNRSLPCFPAEEDWDKVSALRRPIQRGFMYFKARKAGSSTLAGVALRMARNIAKSQNLQTPLCQTRFGHPPAWYLEYHRRDRLNSFLWSVLREPTKRHISEFFHFAVSRDKIEPTDDAFQRYFAENAGMIENYYVNFMKIDKPFDQQSGNHTEAVEHIMQAYDFIGILERLDESLVALQMILGLNTSDILYLRAKTNGGFDDGVYNDQCFYIVQSYVSPGMRQFFDTSPWWYNFTKGNVLLYQTVYKSLDRTIDLLGRAEFNRNLLTFKRAIAFANSQCTNVTYPCSPGGRVNKKHDCLWTDSGCGFQCLDRIGNQLTDIASLG